METNTSKRLIIASLLILLFAIIVIIWYFFYTKPVSAPSLTGTNNPLARSILPPRFQFLNWGGENGTSTAEVSDPAKDPLVQIWDKPASGQTFVDLQVLQEETSTTTVGTSTQVVEIKKTTRATSTVVYFVDRTTGYLYGYPIATGKTYQVTNTLIPGVYDAYILNNGTRVLMRYEDKEKGVIIGVVATVPNVPINGSPVPLENIQYLNAEVTSVATNNKHTEASYVVTTKTGSAVYTLKSKGAQLITSSPFREWDIAYGGNTLYLTTKPSAYVQGITVSLPTFESKVGERTGLTTTPGENEYLLHSMWSKEGLKTFVSRNGSIKVLDDIETLAWKCTWSGETFLFCGVPRIILRGKEGLPDDWLQGRTQFADDFISFNVATGEKFNLYTFSDSLGEFDVQNLVVSNDKRILFNNRRDETLWMLTTDLINTSE